MKNKTFRWIFAGLLASFALHSCGSSGGTDVTDTNTTPESPCATYCELIASQCTGELAIDFGDGACDSVCPLFPPGTTGDTSGDSVACRIHYLQDGSTGTTKACAIATPAGGNLEVGFLCGGDQPSDGCTGSADMAILEDTDPFLAGDECYHNCKAEDLGEACISQCIADGTGLTNGCATCASNATMCTYFQCPDECEAGPETTDCVACRETSGCTSAFVSCSGIGTPTDPPECGNGQCEEGETNDTCSQDCEATVEPCGNGICEEGEDLDNCPMDCDQTTAQCGNGVCELGETPDNCLQDCDGVAPEGCGDGKCGEGETPETCPQDCEEGPESCGNGTCDEGESSFNCPKDCQQGTVECGNGTCDEGENDLTCPEDCPKDEAKCPDGECQEEETVDSCPEDCAGDAAVCGNKVCEEGETDQTCPADCDTPEAVCGNGQCDEGETNKDCPEDCKN